MSTDVRERSRSILRLELARGAADLCLERGFEAVTVEEMAQHVGISRATFFRYFTSKDDVIAVAMGADRRFDGERLRELLAEADGLPALSVVRGALGPLIDDVDEHPDRRRALMALVVETPSLRALTSVERSRQREVLVAALADHVDPDEALALSSAAMAALELAWALWMRDGGSFGSAVERAFALLGAVDGVVARPSMR